MQSDGSYDATINGTPNNYGGKKRSKGVKSNEVKRKRIFWMIKLDCLKNSEIMNIPYSNSF